MGLDIVVYKKLKRVENPEFDEDGDLVDYSNQWHAGPTMEWSESCFPGRADGIDPEAVYTWDDDYYFRAGSYSGYNMWRELLSELSDGSDFIELINFADNEGVIGPVISKKLYNDFQTNYFKAVQYSKEIEDGEYWISKYKEWMKAFEFASEDGAVIFC